MKTAFAIAFVLTAVFAISAQEQKIDRTVFENALAGSSTHARSWSGKPYRMTVTTSAKMVDKPEVDHGAKMVFEHGTNREYRDLYTSTSGGRTRTAETLILGDYIYKRENEGPWTVTAKTAPSSESPSPPAPGENVYQVLSTETQYFSLGAQPFEGGTASVFKKVEKISKVLKTTGSASDSVTTNTYWIVDGIQRKHELRSANKFSASSSNNTVITEWDLDPTITFTAPVVAK